ncbi:MAG TPA: MFS transporter, partial [Xanthobacteraceae bacterium]|nr:MFS transporter [Xanthobacteraceae bacterium]
MQASEQRPPADARTIYATAGLRALATGLIGVLLGLYLAQLGYTPVQLGVVVGAGLSGAALSTLLVTLLGDRLGRRRSLIVLALLAASGGVALLLTTHFAALSAVAFLGMVNGMGRDRAAALVLEHAALPQTADA